MSAARNSPEQARKHLHRQEKARLAAHPARPIERYPATWHNHMDVRMVGHCRAPAVEHGGGADARAQVFGIGGDREYRQPFEWQIPSFGRLKRPPL